MAERGRIERGRLREHMIKRGEMSDIMKLDTPLRRTGDISAEELHQICKLAI